MKKNKLAHTMMVWEGRDPKVTATQNVTWAIEHFEDKYEMKVTTVGCNDTTLTELTESFPNLTIFADKKAYAPNQFHIYGSGIPEHKIDELD